MNHYSDNEIISLLHFRLRTERCRKRAKKKDKDKKLLALHREERELWQQQRSLGWIELNPPVTRGWKRYFVLRPDVARSKRAAFFEGILQKINMVEYSHRKDFKRKKRRQGKKIYVVKEQRILSPDACHFSKLKFTDREKQMFTEVISYDQYKRRFVKKYVFVEPWRFVLRVRPNIITKTRARDEVIESRIRQIDNHLDRNDLRGRINHLTGRRGFVWWNGERKKEINPLRNKSIPAILDELKHE